MEKKKRGTNNIVIKNGNTTIDRSIAEIKNKYKWINSKTFTPINLKDKIVKFLENWWKKKCNQAFKIFPQETQSLDNFIG